MEQSSNSQSTRRWWNASLTAVSSRLRIFKWGNMHVFGREIACLFANGASLITTALIAKSRVEWGKKMPRESLCKIAAPYISVTRRKHCHAGQRRRGEAFQHFTAQNKQFTELFVPYIVPHFKNRSKNNSANYFPTAFSCFVVQTNIIAINVNIIKFFQLQFLC